MKVLVTGASGFIGSHLVEKLAGRGEEVRALYRRQVPPDELLALSAKYGRAVELFRADLGDSRLVEDAARGIDAVIHTAARASDWGSLELFMRENYDATVSLLEASRNAGVRTFLYFSSAVVHGFGPHVDTTERGPYYPLKYPYQMTKQLTEAYVLKQNSPEFRVTAIRPCNVYGPGDRTSTYAMYGAIMDGVFGYIGSGNALTCPVYIDDLCAGTLAALDSPSAAGQALLLTDGEKVSWKAYCGAMYAAVGSKKKPASLPVGLATVSAAVLTSAARLVGSRKAPPLTMYRVEQASQNYHFSNAKARDLIGFEPTVFYEEGLLRTAEAFLKERERATRA
jgi:nucleoside-diphosphate-sugar epimerase